MTWEALPTYSADFSSNMGGSMITNGFVVIGILSLFHAAYSAAQHRSYLRLVGIEESALPIDITIQALLSMMITMYGRSEMGSETVEYLKQRFFSTRLYQKKVAVIEGGRHQARAV
ncbi:unnamed protein product [Cyprideis torosa]|uniref:Membrane magnesium transporter n=1 Tax=Cyprideis torosa TaxID=163714 RepID=A0A7R8WPL8_9CRUS|nr:unnamed protein product [Cyprideis torosa]CAG0900894.1 unnamed protein product [Cyprideis torosa]